MAHRIERINNLIRQEISELLQRQVKDPRLDAFVGVTEVITSSDLKYAKVFVSNISNKEQKQEILNALAGAAVFFRKELAKNLRLRHIPELIFYWDDSIERGDYLIQLIDKVISKDR